METSPVKTTSDIKSSLMLGKPVIGPTGAKIIAYEWRSMLIDDVDSRGEDVVRRVSDWDQSGTSQGTGRCIVHWFWVEHLDGRVTLEGVNSAQKILGIRDARLYSIARRERESRATWSMALESAVDDMEKAALPYVAAEIHAWAVSNRRPFCDGDGYKTTLLEKGGKFIATIKGEHADILLKRGWRTVYVEERLRMIHHDTKHHDVEVSRCINQWHERFRKGQIL